MEAPPEDFFKGLEKYFANNLEGAKEDLSGNDLFSKALLTLVEVKLDDGSKDADIQARIDAMDFKGNDIALMFCVLAQEYSLHMKKAHNLLLKRFGKAEEEIPELESVEAEEKGEAGEKEEAGESNAKDNAKEKPEESNANTKEKPEESNANTKEKPEESNANTKEKPEELNTKDNAKPNTNTNTKPNTNAMPNTNAKPNTNTKSNTKPNTNAKPEEPKDSAPSSTPAKAEAKAANKQVGGKRVTRKAKPLASLKGPLQKRFSRGKA